MNVVSSLSLVVIRLETKNCQREANPMNMQGRKQLVAQFIQFFLNDYSLHCHGVSGPSSRGRFFFKSQLIQLVAIIFVIDFFHF